MSEGISAKKAWNATFGLFLIMTAIVAGMWLIGLDLTAERLTRIRIGDFAAFGSRRLWTCGIVRGLDPTSFSQNVPCIVWNIGTFYLIPAFALCVAVRKSLARPAPVNRHQ